MLILRTSKLNLLNFPIIYDKRKLPALMSTVIDNLQKICILSISQCSLCCINYM